MQTISRTDIPKHTGQTATTETVTPEGTRRPVTTTDNNLIKGIPNWVLVGGLVVVGLIVVQRMKKKK